jgi:hypothetical protein
LGLTEAILARSTKNTKYYLIGFVLLNLHIKKGAISSLEGFE